MIRRVLAAAISSAMILCCSGCLAVTFSDMDGGSGVLVGEGPMTTLEYTVGDYTAVEADNVEFELYYKAEKSDKVTIELQENLTEDFSVSVNDGVLTITSDRSFKTRRDEKPKLYLSTPGLERLTVGGGFFIMEADAIKGDSFTLDVSGAVDGDLLLEVDKLDVSIAGACSLTLSGSAREAGIRTSGASHIDALELETEDTRIEVNGAGDIEIACSNTLDVTVSGTGSVNYKGDPHVTQNVAGAVSVKRMD